MKGPRGMVDLFCGEQARDCMQGVLICLDIVILRIFWGVGGGGGRNEADMRAMWGQSVPLLFAVILLPLVITEAFVLWLLTSIFVFLHLLHPVPFFMQKKFGSLLNKNWAPSLVFFSSHCWTLYYCFRYWRWSPAYLSAHDTQLIA